MKKATTFRTSLALLATAISPVFYASAQIPHFLSPVSYAVPGASMAVVADINGDGILDIVTANGYVSQGSGVSVLLGNGDGTFQAAKTIVSGGNPSWVLVGDFNHDGKPDIAVANEPNPNAPLTPPTVGGPAANSVSILLGHGDGTFAASIDTPTAGALALAAADFNGDGKLDLAVSTGASLPLQVLLGNGDGTFSVINTAAFGSSAALAGDFNHDGKPDLVIDNFVLFGNGDGTFSTGPTLNIGAQIIADFNGDGLLDIAGEAGFGKPAQVSGEISPGVSNGTWNPLVFTTNFTSSSNLILADFNGDGRPDIFGPGSGFQTPGRQILGGLFLSNGDGTFSQTDAGFGMNFDASTSSFFPAFAAAGDLDRNGSQDVVIAAGTGVLVALNTGGQPASLAKVSVNGSTLVGGSSTVTGTVSLGGPAPVGGAVVTLTSSNAAALLSGGNSVTIPAGVQSASFNITTGRVSTSTPVTITAAYRGVTQTTSFTLVAPFTLASVSPVTVIGMFGGAAATGTVTLTGPASDGVVISLVSGNNALVTLPATVAIPAGATSATFPMTALHVAADTPVTITATLAGTSRSATVTVKKEVATVTVTKVELVVKKGQLTINATSTDIGGPPGAKVPSLQVYNPSTGVLLGTLIFNGANKNVGTFTGQLQVTGSLPSIAVQSFAGGLAIATVAQK